MGSEVAFVFCLFTSYASHWVFFCFCLLGNPINRYLCVLHHVHAETFPFGAIRGNTKKASRCKNPCTWLRPQGQLCEEKSSEQEPEEKSTHHERFPLLRT